ncbi:type VI secretion system protein TssA [Roseococcus suduntuyensis]|uniref:Type VI secretion system protein ImpA n=1 Tax=Roseococcus suduntuyensis TaxID=455361 RepID=A0A840A9M5_9PROT|nr:type VI secretion system protein TssA [Roseococcus suduntuyensis]MBB3896885.1 type VI secretion system protein ImpA [Roseococcus suduntuyensis]
MSEDVVDVAALVAPLEGGDGAGEFLRDDKSAASLYYRLRDAISGARDEDRARDSEEGSEGAVSEGWRQVRKLGVEALTDRTKDFEVAAMLTEALVRLEGLRGLTAGAKVLTGLLEQHWDAGHPLPDEDGLDGRSYPLGGLDGGDRDGTVMQPLRRVVLFERPGGGPLTLHQYEAAMETAGIADEERRERRYAQGVLPLDTIETEAKFRRDALLALVAQVEAARAAWQAYAEQADARFGMEAPSTRRVSTVLERIAEVARRLLGPAAEVAEPVAFEAAAAVPGAAPGAGPAPAMGFAVPPGAVASREQALEMLETISEFFQKTEPHSFLAYTLADAARRGRMTLPQLLEEVLQDETARTAMLTALGIRPTPPE